MQDEVDIAIIGAGEAAAYATGRDAAARRLAALGAAPPPG
jgi:hypothetical protein